MLRYQSVRALELEWEEAVAALLVVAMISSAFLAIDSVTGSVGPTAPTGASLASDYLNAVQADRPVSFWHLGDAPGSTAAADVENFASAP